MATPIRETENSPISTVSNRQLCTQRTRSNEITNLQDLEAGATVCCRICLENEGGELISPCLCKGSQQFVHRHCLDHWRSIKEGFAFSHCTTCKAQFEFLVVDLSDDIVTRIKHKLFVINDVFRQFLIIQFVIVSLGFYLYIMDSGRKFHGTLNGRIKVFPDNPVPFYYSLGALGLLFIYGCFLVIPRCLSLGGSNRRIATCQNCCLIFYLLECFPAPIMILCFAIVCVLFGVAYGLFTVSLAIQRSWHRQYKLLTKRNLTK
ncbi:unnamed protein product, partial [Cuscuta epithymum]